MLKRKNMIYLVGVLFIFMDFVYPVNSYGKDNVTLETTDTIETKLNIHFDSELDKHLDKTNFLNDIFNEDLDLNNIDFEKKTELTLGISMPKEFVIPKSEAKIYAENHFKNEIENLASLFDINPDIDDVNFQTIAKSYGLEDENFVRFAKFIDIYENYDYNNEMKDIIENIESVKYTSYKQLIEDDKLNTLVSMMPIDTTKYKPTMESNVITNAYSTRILSGYSGRRAREYAKKWAYKTNNTSYGYYAKYNNHKTPYNNDMWSGGSGNNERTWQDCANFVSQCLEAGGAKYIKKGWLNPHRNNENWYYSSSKPSHSWGGANNFQKHWANRVGIRSGSADSKVGDPISLDYDGDKVADHTVIITTVNGTGSKQMLYACHTNDQFEKKGKSLSTLFDYYENVWIYPLS